MLLTTPENIRWRRWSYLVLSVLTISYIWYAFREYAHGGSWIGVTYGIGGLVGVIVLMYFGVRKRSYKSQFGTLENWLHSHIYLGILVFFMILFHSGFRFNDKVAVTAFFLLTIVAISGVIGAFLYTLIPPRMINVESNLSSREIAEKMNDLATAMARISREKSAAFQQVCKELIKSQQPDSIAGWRVLKPKYLTQQVGKSDLSSIRDYLLRIEPGEQPDFSRLVELSNQMQEMHHRLVQKQRYVNVMAVWLYVHLPVSFAMMVAIVVHITAAFYYSFNW